MRIALAQINPTSGDIAGNERRIATAIDAARAAGAELLVAPEMVVPGYCIGDQIEDAGFLAANRAAAERIAARSDGLAVIFGFIEHDSAARNEDGRIRKYNAAAVAQGGRIVGIARKSLLPSYRYFDDKRYFTPAAERRPIAIRAGGRTVGLGVSICEDMWDATYAAKPVAELCAQGAELVVNINASPFYPGRLRDRLVQIRAHVEATGRPFVYVNTVGAGDNGKNIIAFDGESLAMDGRGRILHVSPRFREAVEVVEVPLAGAASGPAVAPPPCPRDEVMYDALVFSLREYARHCGFSRAVVPVSGGIDSALALAVTADAFGPANVVAYNLPSRHNTELTRSLAAEVSRNLGVDYRVMAIQAIDDAAAATFERDAHPVTRRVTRENLSARVRGVLMMMESNDSGRLLIACGNETELALGYATLYGDMCGGVAVIGDLSKLDVYLIARHVNARRGAAAIPEAIIRLKPSAELSDGQFDPFDYWVTAPLVGEMIEKRHSPAEIVEAFRTRSLDPERFVPDPDGRTVYDKLDAAAFEALVRETRTLMLKAVYKRLQAPPIIVVSERAFGFDLRETIINGWTG